MPVKLAYKLSHQVLFPGPIERQSVQLTSAVFCESTLEALRYYSARGNPEFSETAEFISIILQWWKLANAKSTFLATMKRDQQREAITAENLTAKTSFLRGFVDWLSIWESSCPKENCLSLETSEAAKHSSECLASIFEYLIHDVGLRFVLPIKLQNDKIEGRFGQLRQMCGGNMFASVRQFLESDRSLKMMNLAKLNLESSELQDVFQEANEELEQKIEASSRNIVKAFSKEEIEVAPEIPAADNDALLYVAGCFSRQVSKSLNCSSCKSLILHFEKEKDFASDKSYISQVNRGGLTYPSELTFLLCAHAWDFYQKIMKHHETKSIIQSLNMASRKLFVVSFAKYLSDSYETRLNFVEQSCDQGHYFKRHLMVFAAKCYNLFSKNYISVLNSAIHESRRSSSKNEEKRSATTLKTLKLQSESA